MDPDDLEAYSIHLREIARYAYDQRVPFSSITSEHRNVLGQAIKNVLGTQLSIFTYAQIIDGLPTADVAWDRRLPGIFGDHVIDDVHEELCSGAIDRAKEFYETWDPSILMFDSKVVQDYHEADRGSKPFDLRLIELVAVSLHQIGVALYKLDLRLHNGDIDSVTNWKIPYSPSLGLVDVPPRPTLFSHPGYLDDDVYPEGIADIVGYWVEDRILGGVVLFDRRLPADPLNLPNVYFHSCRRRVTERIYQLRDDQQQALLDFLLGNGSLECPLPVLADKQNRVRFDWPTALTHHRIYRDIWERKPLTDDELCFFERRPQDEIDYPEIGFMIRSLNERPGGPRPERRPRTPSPPPRSR